MMGSVRRFYFSRGAFRPFKVTQSHLCWCQLKARIDFLLVSNSNLGPVLHRFGDDSFYVLLTPPLFNPNFGGVPVAPDRRYRASTSARTLSYLAVKLFSKHSNRCENIPQRHRRMDRRTDRLTTQSHNSAPRSIARYTPCPGKKRPKYSRHNFDKFSHSFEIFGTNHPDTSLY